MAETRNITQELRRRIMAEGQKCAFCHAAGSRGAKWEIKVTGEVILVHKPCGEKLVAQAPKGSGVKLVPGRELREEWRAERETRQARTFWTEKFQKARTVPAPKPA